MKHILVRSGSQVTALSKRTVDPVHTWVVSSALIESAGSLFVITLGTNLVALMNGIRSLMAHLLCMEEWLVFPKHRPPPLFSPMDVTIPLQISQTNRQPQKDHGQVASP